MKIEIQVKPTFDQLAERFKGFEEILLGKLREGLYGFGLLVERGSKQYSPHDTGRMRASIGTSMGIIDKGLTTYVQPNVDYAIYVHEGTRYMVGRPFMKWGLDAYHEQGERVIANKVKEATEELAKAK